MEVENECDELDQGLQPMGWIQHPVFPSLWVNCSVPPGIDSKAPLIAPDSRAGQPHLTSAALACCAPGHTVHQAGTAGWRDDQGLSEGLCCTSLVEQ